MLKDIFKPKPAAAAAESPGKEEALSGFSDTINDFTQDFFTEVRRKKSAAVPQRPKLNNKCEGGRKRGPSVRREEEKRNNE